MVVIRPTLKETTGKVDARITIPFWPPVLLDHQRYLHSSVLPGLNQKPILGPEADDDLWDTKQEGLNPELHELTFKVVSLTVVLYYCRRLELHPVDRVSWGPWFVVPY